MEKIKKITPPRPTHEESKIYFKILLEIERVAERFYIYNSENHELLYVYAKKLLSSQGEEKVKAFVKGFTYDKFMCYENEELRPPYISYFIQVEKILKKLRLEKCEFVERVLNNHIKKNKEKIECHEDEELE